MCALSNVIPGVQARMSASRTLAQSPAHVRDEAMGDQASAGLFRPRARTGRQPSRRPAATCRHRANADAATRLHAGGWTWHQPGPSDWRASAAGLRHFFDHAEAAWTLLPPPEMRGPSGLCWRSSSTRWPPRRPQWTGLLASTWRYESFQ